MQYCIKFWKYYGKKLDKPMDMQFGIIANIYRQKKIINNSMKYTKEEKILIMKGLDLAKDRVWCIDWEKELI